MNPMKKLFLILSLVIVNLIHSQIIKIKVFETITYDREDTKGLMSVIYQTPENAVLESANCEYVLDFGNNTIKYYWNGDLEAEMSFIFEKVSHLYIVNFVYENFDTGEGIIVDLDPRNERFIWFSKMDNLHHIEKGTKFEIVKGS
jgi:hypothetical protein